jgi:hypothetical protein
MNNRGNGIEHRRDCRLSASFYDLRVQLALSNPPLILVLRVD